MKAWVRPASPRSTQKPTEPRATEDRPLVTPKSSVIITTSCPVFGFTSLGYLVPLSIVHPAPQLLTAIALEAVWFLSYLGFSLYRLKSTGGRAQDAVISELVSQVAVIEDNRKNGRRVLMAMALITWLAMLIDLSAFLLAFCGQFNASAAIYRAVPISTCLGLNVAASLEVLGGAYVEAGKYPQALSIYREVETIRQSHYGAVSEKMAAIFADYGDLYTKMGTYDKAETSYKTAIDLANQILGNQGTGRAYTRLANLLTQIGRLPEADYYYQKALTMREKQFGKESAKVAETLFAYSVLLEKSGKKPEAKLAQERAEKIYQRLKANSKTGKIDYQPLMVMAVSIFVSWLLFGKKGYLTELAVRRLKNRIETGSKTSAKDLKTLALIYQYQNKKDELERLKLQNTRAL